MFDFITDAFKNEQFDDRRATARHALGKHRAAAQDVMRALRIEPSSKALLAQRQRILAALRSAAADAAKVCHKEAVEVLDAAVVRRAQVAQDWALPTSGPALCGLEPG